MSDWIDRLGAHAREQEAGLDPRLARLCAGTATEEERRALEAEAAQDPALAEQLEAWRPLGDEARAATARALVDALSTAPLDASARARITERLVVRTRRQRRAVWLRRVVPAALALAAGLVLAVLVRPSSRPLPRYEAALSGGAAELRAEDAPVRWTDDAPLVLTLTPIERVDRPVALHAFVVHDGRRERWEVPHERAPTGAFRIRGKVAELLGPRRGRLELQLVLGAEDWASAEAIASGAREGRRLELVLERPSP